MSKLLIKLIMLLLYNVCERGVLQKKRVEVIGVETAYKLEEALII